MAFAFTADFMNMFIAMKRMRPQMGTFLEISVEGSTPKVEAALTAGFAQAARLERLVSKFEPDSWPNRFNRWDGGWPWAIPVEIFPLFRLAFELFKDSGGAFDPFTPAGDLDLTGIAKGWIVDQVAEHLALQCPDQEICVNAGGDLRFVNSIRRPVTLRTRSGLRQLELPQAALAVSSLASDHPSTVYHKTSRRAVSVAVIHSSCAVADALTKVALFAPEPEHILARHQAVGVVLDS